MKCSKIVITSKKSRIGGIEMSVTAIEKKALANFINGHWVKSTTDKYEEVPNPATGEILVFGSDLGYGLV